MLSEGELNNTQPQPIIIGAGISGTLVSLILSRHHIPHILIGDPPSPKPPRLGESLDLDGTLCLLRLFPELSEFFYSKKCVDFYLGRELFTCGFEFQKKYSTRLFFRLTGDVAPYAFLHVDRLGLDIKLFELSTGSPYCTWFNERVSHLDYDNNTDKINTVILSSGEELPADYVFDASNYARLVAKSANVEQQFFSDLQRVVFTHYRAAPDATHTHPPEQLWLDRTTLVRLHQELDGIDAMAWCIPVNNYVSVGISTRADANNFSTEATLNLLEQAYMKRGVCYSEIFPNPTDVKSITHRYFFHERAYGANWLLVGSTYGLVWWMAGAGVGTSLMAARYAPKILKKPKRMGRLYQEYVQGLLNNHWVFNDAAIKPYQTLEEEGTSAFSYQIARLNFTRYVDSLQLYDNKLMSIWGRVINRTAAIGFVDRWLKTRAFCAVQPYEFS